MIDCATAQLLLLRHGEVRSHRGDVPITDEGSAFAQLVGSSLPDRFGSGFEVLCGETRRARETAHHISEGIRESGGSVTGPRVAHALRNPDLYLGGERVNMVSSHQALADQVEWLSVERVADLDFYPQFIAETDRIGWWLGLTDPPGEDAGDVAKRIVGFARSLVNPSRPERGTVVAVTHSPLLRAFGLHALGRDIGEPAWVSGFVIAVGPDGLHTSLFPEA